MRAALRLSLDRHADLALVALVLAILLVLFAPIPPMVLDGLIILNVGFALLLLMLTFTVARPVEFSTFPALLLVATLLRLSLNIAATRLILTQAGAGEVIGAIGAFMVGGNAVVGLIVFLILVVVQYVVVTSGAQRVSEVAARFTLDGMPGQQMSIDADLNMGFIDQTEAMRRRRLIEKEAGFYGAMDGASKFVKGDAIAGIVILLIDIVGGLIIGVVQLGMGWGDALHTYTLLTIGDGIVTQVPALVISVGTGIIVTRSGSDAQLGTEVWRQLTSQGRALAVVAVALLALSLLPGLPMWPALLLVIGLGLPGLLLRRGGTANASDPAAPGASSPNTAAGSDDPWAALDVAPVELRLGSALAPLAQADGLPLLDRVAAFRLSHAQATGFVVPAVQVSEQPTLDPERYEVRVHGATVASGDLRPGAWLALGGQGVPAGGEATRDPSYGLSAWWIGAGGRDAAQRAGFTLVDAPTVLFTHLQEVLRRHAADLLSRDDTARLIDRLRQRHAALVDELIPTVLSAGDVHKVLQHLLREKVSIRPLDLIAEVLADAGRQVKDPAVLTELVRQRLGAVLCEPLRAADGALHVLTLDAALEHLLLRSQGTGSALALDPRLAEPLLRSLIEQADGMVRDGIEPVLLVAVELRRPLRALTERVLPHLRVIALAEVPDTVPLHSHSVVGSGLTAPVEAAAPPSPQPPLPTSGALRPA